MKFPLVSFCIYYITPLYEKIELMEMFVGAGELFEFGGRACGGKA
jgi:hypothetical protein